MLGVTCKSMVARKRSLKQTKTSWVAERRTSQRPGGADEARRCVLVARDGEMRANHLADKRNAKTLRETLVTHASRKA